MKRYSSIIYLILSALLLLQCKNAGSQVTWTVPGTYPTILSAVTALNAAGVPAGGLNIDVAAGHVETSVNIVMNTITATAANPIMIRKVGAGANPLIQSNAIGSGSINPPLSGNGDCFIEIFSTDYVTIDGIDLLENYTGVNTTLMIEYGIFLTKIATDACNHITIRNCNISMTLKTTYSRGIFQSNVNGLTGASVNVNNTGGQCNNNAYDLNTIQNVYSGIYLHGYSLNFFDLNCTIGTGGGNTITNYGTTTLIQPIYCLYQKNPVVANNTLNGGTGSTSTCYGIWVQNANNSNVDVFNNTITLLNSGNIKGVYVTGGTLTGGFINTINIYNNNVTGCINADPSFEFGGIIHEAPAANTNIYNNTITNNKGGQLLYCLSSSAYSANLSIHDNIISNCHAIDDNFGVSRAYYTTTAFISSFAFYNNIISDITCANSIFEVGLFTGFFGTGGSQNIYNNRIFNIISTSHFAGATLAGLNLPTGENVNVFNNMISNLNCIAGSTCQSIIGMQTGNSITGAINNISHNTIYLSATGSAANFTSTALYINASKLTLSNNIICNTSNHLGAGRTNAIEKHPSMSLLQYLPGSNNNSVYAGPAAVMGNNIFYDGAVAYSSFPVFQSLVTPAESNSISINPFPFFTSINDVHISLCAGCILDNGGQPMPSITNDYDYEWRSNLTPEIGADEITIGLPVTLIDFNAIAEDASIKLKWATSSEINNDHFIVEKSTDGFRFIEIDKIDGNGTATSAHTYFTYDKDPDEGINYYRLKQVDYNGTFEYSDIISVNWIGGAEFNITAAPNPFTDELVISINGPDQEYASLFLFNSYGYKVWEGAVFINEGTKTMHVETASLAPGIYWLQIKSEGYLESIALIKK